MSSKKGRVTHNWTTPLRALLKCIAVRLHDQDFRGMDLYRAFRKIVPDWQDAFDGSISDNALIQRADKARREGYETEWPENNPTTKPYWQLSGTIAKAGKVYKIADLQRTIDGYSTNDHMTDLRRRFKRTYRGDKRTAAELSLDIEELELFAASKKLYATAKALRQAKEAFQHEHAETLPSRGRQSPLTAS